MNTEENKTKGPARFVMNCRFFFDFAGVMGSLLFELKNGQSDCEWVGFQHPDVIIEFQQLFLKQQILYENFKRW